MVGRNLLLLSVASLVLTGCATTFGARTIGPARINYNEAISRSWNEQLLMNLVRLRYRDTLQYMQISSVLTQYTYEAGASADGSFGEGSDDRVGVGVDAGYSERPTISYVPLQGEEFARRFLVPLSAETILLLSQSGWSVERLLLCCVQELNDLRNAPSAAGPTPEEIPSHFREFQRAAELLRRLQRAGVLHAGQRRTEQGDVVVVRIDGTDTRFAADRHELAGLLGLASPGGEYELSHFSSERRQKDIVVTGRSLMGTLFFLSQSVEVPREHEQLGKVTVTRDADGNRFDWSELTGKLLRVRTSPERPVGAFVGVRYRGHWFYIDDSDLDSKTTFGLLGYLFSLQSGPGGRSPLLTVTAGG